MQIQDTPTLKAEARNLNFFYSEAQALKNINMPIYDKKGDSHYDTISAFIKSVRASDQTKFTVYLD